MNIKSINVVKQADVPVTARNTQSKQVAEQILARMKTLSNGQALSIELTDVKKYSRYALRRALIKQGGNGLVVSQRENTMFVSREISAK